MSAQRYAAVLAAVREGYEVHYDRRHGDLDSALLDGDRLYALGLERLVALGDVEAVADLAELIARCAAARAAADVGGAEAAWASTTARWATRLAGERS